MPLNNLSRNSKMAMKVIADVLSFILSFIVTSLLVFNTLNTEFLIPGIVTAVITVVLLYLFHYYSVKLENSSIELISRGLRAFGISFVLSLIYSAVIADIRSISFAVIYLTYAFVFSLGCRFIFRYSLRTKNLEKAKEFPKAIIYGAGDIGTMLARQYYAGKLEYELTGYVDDDQTLQKTDILGLPVLGTVDSLSDLIKKNGVRTLIIGITNLSQENLYKAVDAAKDNGADVKIIPTLYEMQQGAKELDLRNLDYPDLLGRPLIKIDKAPIEEMVRDKVVLVTGACGSIGSEIAKQVTGFRARRVILIDIDESGLHDMGLRLTNYKEEVNDKIIPILCDIKNAEKIERIFRQYKPDIVYHAAAYKHVPMGEREPDEIIKTNVAGSYNVLASARNNNVKKVVVISTDKAVNPTNVMGASKRMVELVASMLTCETTEIVAVRFGNVLGSRGSMLPLFIDQIHAGVPITVTHKDIIRYFMAIPEAVSLVLKAGAMAKGGEVMVLDMGQPVKIYDFHHNTY